MKQSIILILVLLFMPHLILVGASQDSATATLSYPGKNWSLEISPSFSEFSRNIEGDAVMFAGGRGKVKKLHPVMVNIRMQRATAPGDALGVRELFKNKLRKSSTVVQESIKLVMHNDVPMIRYSIDGSALFGPGMGSGGFERMKIFQAFYVKDDVWIIVALNFHEMNKEDEEFLSSVLDSVKILEPPQVSPTPDQQVKL